MSKWTPDELEMLNNAIDSTFWSDSIYGGFLIRAAKELRQHLTQPPVDALELLEELEVLVSWHDKTAVKTAIDLNPNDMWGKARAAIANYKAHRAQIGG